jgi:hypothetical protein
MSAKNAVRSAFKAGITPSRIALEFGIPLSDVRQALARDERVHKGEADGAKLETGHYEG